PVNVCAPGLSRAGDADPASRPMLGIGPGGSANVFAGALGLPRDPVEATHQLLQAIETGRSTRSRVGMVDDRWFTFNAGIGWDAEVVAAVDNRRRKQASPTLYVRTALGHCAGQACGSPELTGEVPGEEPISGVRLAMVCNANPWTYLGSKPVRLVPQ